MNPTTPPTEPQETREPELVIKAPADDSLPAEQVLAEQIQDAGEPLAPRFIP